MNEFYDNPYNKLMVVMGKMNNSIMDKMHGHLKEMAINQTEFLVMYALDVQGKLTIQDIGERIFITSGSMTYTIDKLEKRGYVTRIRCLEDRRKIFIDLTHEGRRFWHEQLEDHKRFLEGIFGDVDPRELNEFIRLSKLIGKAVESS